MCFNSMQVAKHELRPLRLMIANVISIPAVATGCFSIYIAYK